MLSTVSLVRHRFLSSHHNVTHFHTHFTTPAFSTPATSCRIVHSRTVHSRIFSVPVITTAAARHHRPAMYNSLHAQHAPSTQINDKPAYTYYLHTSRRTVAVMEHNNNVVYIVYGRRKQKISRVFVSMGKLCQYLAAHTTHYTT